jgi:hypothetical protein
VCGRHRASSAHSPLAVIADPAYCRGRASQVGYAHQRQAARETLGRLVKIQRDTFGSGCLLQTDEGAEA